MNFICWIKKCTYVIPGGTIPTYVGHCWTSRTTIVRLLLTYIWTGQLICNVDKWPKNLVPPWGTTFDHEIQCRRCKKSNTPLRGCLSLKKRVGLGDVSLALYKKGSSTIYISTFYQSYLTICDLYTFVFYNLVFRHRNVAPLWPFGIF
jgi:hypothetical protein